ncbi:Ig-like domain repeat protein [Nocardia tengchongensis]|uniref:Ig-like domain repeat protein n=1 Tax=Nocardia tengchongensis TaxID=2055889 RepID=UPI003647465F
MIGTAALLLVAPGASLVNAEPAAPALPADLVTAIHRDLGLTPAQYLDRAETGQNLAKFAASIRATFPDSFAGAWLDTDGAPLVGLADGPDKAAARTAVEVAGYKVKDQSRSERTLLDQLGQLTGWIQQLPAPLAGLVNSAEVDPVNNGIALKVRDTAAGQGLQLPDFLQSVRVAREPAPAPAQGPSGSSDPTTTKQPAKPTEPTKPTESTKPTAPASKITLSPITGATVGKPTPVTLKINPVAAGGDITFEASVNGGNFEPFTSAASFDDDGTTTTDWYPQTAGKVTIKATFSGPNGVTVSTTQQVTVAPASNPATTTITLEPVKGATVGKAVTLKAKVNNPSEPDGTIEFKDGTAVLILASVQDDGTATVQWTPTTAGQHTITATFSGFADVALATTTQQVTVAGPTKPKPPAPDTIMGGQAYLAGGLCSLGFNATDGSGHAVAISAGHCAGVGAEAKLGEYPDGTYLGTVDKAVIHGGDYLLINIDDSVAKRFENNFVDTHGGDPLPITGTADPVVGAPACKSGRTTGYTCGKVTAIDQYEFGAGGVWMSDAIKFDACGRPGDSGSAIVTGTKALGITSMVLDANGDCNNSPNTTWGQPINSILKDNPGLKIRTN